MSGEQDKRSVPNTIVSTRDHLGRLWQGLGIAQRIGLITVLAVVVASFVITISNANKPRMIAFTQSMNSSSGRQAFVAMLEEQGIPSEVSADGVVRVPEEKLEQIKLIASQLQARGENHDFFSWIEEKASFTETTRRFTRRWDLSKKREVESAISRIEGVENATVTVNLTRRSSLLNRQDAGASASVFLDIDGSVENDRLPSPVARGVGYYVASSYGLKHNQISINDNLGNNYDLGTASTVTDGERVIEEKVRSEVSGLVEGIYPANAFKLLVDVQIAPATVVATSGNSVAGGSQVPSVEVEGLSVSLFVDTGTIIESLERFGEAPDLIGEGNSALVIGAPEENEITTTQRVQKRVEELELMLENHFVVYGDDVVSAHVYAMPLILPDPVASVGPPPTSTQMFMEENWDQMALLAMALLGTILFFIAARKSTNSYPELPEVVQEYRSFLEERKRFAEAHQRELESRTEVETNAGRADEDLLDELHRLALEEPETVSEVLEEFTISFDDDDSVEITGAQEAK